ncbi:MAG: signal peptidase II [Candidatus Gastranaerophilales bacterium]|nr:signal peptidase II [Candidatus Gastranaerophilales bacterium]
MKDKKAFLFYFLMSIIFLDFGNQIKKISYNPYIENHSNPIFSISHTTNQGGAFGVFQNHTNLLAIFGIIAIALITFYVYKNIKFSDKTALLSITLFTAGALGNLIERITNGYVIDYIKLNFIDFPIFNMFDILICLGIFIYAIFVLIEQKKVINEQKLQNNSDK